MSSQLIDNLSSDGSYPLHHLCRNAGISQEWWDVVFTPHYTASFLTDKLDNMCAVTGPIIEMNIPLCPKPDNAKDCVLTTCETWLDAGVGIQDVFARMTKDCIVKTSTRITDVQVRLRVGRLAADRRRRPTRQRMINAAWSDLNVE